MANNNNLSNQELSRYLKIAKKELKAGGKIRINRFVPYIAIFTSSHTEYFIDMQEAQTILNQVPKNITPEKYVLVQSLEWEKEALKNQGAND